VFEALRAGASGFVLKDDSPEQLIAAIRTVANGDALLSPDNHQTRDPEVRPYVTSGSSQATRRAQ
jgi:DNA-binding NarL/FixJ family response regulator